MTEEQFYILLRKYLQGKTTPEEENIVESFYNKNQQKETVPEYAAGEREKMAARLKLQLIKRIHAEDHLTRKSPAASRMFVGIAAALISFIFLGVWFFNFYENADDLITVSTGRNERITVILPDGSKVKMNSQSKVVYSRDFSDKDKREIELTGEAFFEVVRDEQKPFVITSNGLQTTVLGTSFNVEAYPTDSEVAVTVATGKVSVRDGESESYLLPGQQAVFDQEAIRVREVNVNLVTSWVQDVLIFENASLGEVTSRMEKYYGVEIDTQINSDHCELYLRLDHFTLKEALRQLKLLSGIDYQFITKEKILLTGEGCN